MSELSSLNILCLIVIQAVMVVGVMGNGFIIVTNFIDWLRNKTLLSSDLILIALSLFRFLFLGFIFGLYCQYYLDVHKPKCMPPSMIFAWTFGNAGTLWMATCLIVFYCLKIVNFAQPFFVKMKLKISVKVPHLLLGSLLAALVVSIPVFFFLEDCEQFCNETKIFLNNANGTCLLQMESLSVPCFLYFAGTFPCFVCFLASSVLLICSFLQHFKRMRGNTDGSKDRMMDAHVKAVKTVVLFLIFYCATFASQASFCLFLSPETLLLSVMVVVAFNSGHPIVMIGVNPKLKHALIKSLLAIRTTGYYCPRCVI